MSQAKSTRIHLGTFLLKLWGETFFLFLATHQLNWLIYFGHATPFRILVPSPGIEPGPLAVKAWSPNHGTFREFPLTNFKYELSESFLQSSFLATKRNPHVVGENEANMKRVEVSHGKLVSSDLFKLWFPARPKAKIHLDFSHMWVNLKKSSFYVFFLRYWVGFYLLQSKVPSSLGNLSISVLLRVIFVLKNQECILECVKCLLG